jgi:thiamine biosynthesis lipoprotein
MYAKLLSTSADSGDAGAIPTNPAPDVSVSQPAMGTLFEILIYGSDARNLSAAARQALSLCVELDNQLSRWKEGSEISYINRHAAEEPVRVEPELLDLLLRSREFWRETGGAFDITVAPLVAAWGFYKKEGRLPPQKEIEAALQLVGMNRVRLDKNAGAIRFDRPGMELDLGGIGKGFAVDRAVEFLRSCKIEAALVNSGASTLYAIGSPPGQDGWHIGIRDPRDEEKSIAAIALRDGSISTSGAPEKVLEIEGKPYSHILDPRTGFPAKGMVSASAMALCATDTDALATSFYVLGPDWTRAYCKKHAEVKAVLIPEPTVRQKVELLTINFNSN